MSPPPPTDADDRSDPFVDDVTGGHANSDVGKADADSSDADSADADRADDVFIWVPDTDGDT
jgi:hypothetical protein